MKGLTIVLMLTLTSLLQQGAISNKAAQQQVWPCGSDLNLLVDDQKRPIWIASEELMRHSTKSPVPQVPSSIRAVGTFTVDVLIGTNGRVKCTRVESGHPLLRRAVSDAAQGWVFSRFVVGTKPVSVFGHLNFTFDSQ